MNAQRTLIVNYHYCVSADESPYLARTAVSPADFARQADRMARLPDERDILPLVTFDDGTKDVWRNAVPVLARFGVPSILFLCSLPLAENRLLNVTKVHLLQAKLGFSQFRARFMDALAAVKEPFELDEPSRFGLGRIYRYDSDNVREFKLLLNVRLPYRIVTQLLDALFEPEFGPQAEAVRSIYMSADEIHRARDLGIRIGLHTHSHFMLGRLAPAEQVAEIRNCQDYLANLLGDPVNELSYPYGVPGTWNRETKSIVSSHGISRAYTLGRQIFDGVQAYDPLEIPRYDVNDVYAGDNSFKQELFE
jgi:peptidoglycan/xylan/chitin deacetylase (PgdA/CDA1 family)